MRLPRVRFSVRGMMLAVAALALVLGAAAWVTERGARFTRLRHYYVTLVGRELASAGYYTDRAHWAHRLELKYENAALRPWATVDPDEPEGQAVPGMPPAVLSPVTTVPPSAK
jgi:hypothetical protein